MHLDLKRAIQRSIAVLLIIASVFGCVDMGNIIAYAYTAQGAMINSNDGSLTETKDTPSKDGKKVSALVHGKPVTVVDEVTGTDGVLWYKVTYFVNDGATQKEGYCPASSVRLDKNAAIIATGVANAENTLWSCTGEYQKPALATIPVDTKLYITDNKNDGSLWYRVKCEIDGTTMYGWVESAYVTKDAIPDIPTDEDYEQGLIEMGFPASYAKLLAILHEQYPSWTFVPVNTGLEWEAVIKEESKAGRNLIHKSVNDAKKSVAPTEYNYYTNTWTIRDSSGWVTVHPDYLAYCMDPRNFLDSTNIFMFESLSYNSTHNISGVKAIIKNSFMENDVTDSDGSTLNYANTFMSIGQDVGVSPYHLASRIRQEQGANGTSPLISGTYPGYEGLYNYFNYGAYGTPTSVLYANGLTYARNQGWTSRYLSLLGGSKLLAKNYINVGQDTLYFQKFNVVYKDKLYTHQYMTNVEAAISEGKTVASAYVDKTQAFVFEIPIYLNMPEEPVQFTASGNRNNYLSTLDVAGLALTPSFDGASKEYSVIVDYAVSSVKVSATPVVSTSKVKGVGTYDLNVGSNLVKVVCTSQSGEKRTYKITIVREEKTTAEYTLASDTYSIDKNITGVAPGTSAEDFLAGFTCEGGTLKLLNSSGKEKTGTVATSDCLAVYVDDKLVEEYKIIIYGDVNYDGKITIADLVKLNRHTLNLSKLKGSGLKAADVNGNGSVNIQDLVMINRHILGIETIKQK
ncbi:MAG: SH3 domain-containing protein [Agathobacter sp.]|nr:SH3 domain-containing protein [Agathobacter sp.]